MVALQAEGSFWTPLFLRAGDGSVLLLQVRDLW